MITKSDIKTFLNERVWILRALLIAVVMWLVSSYWYVGACSLVASAVAVYSKNKKRLKYLYLAPLAIPLIFALIYPLISPQFIEFAFPPSKFLIAVSALVFFVLEEKREKEVGLEWLGIALPFALHFIIEFLQKNAEISFRCFTESQMILHYGHAYSVLAILVVATFFHLFFSKRVSWYITAAVFGLFGLVNFFVFTFTSQAFIPSDFLIAGTAFGVIESQTLTSADIVRFVGGLLMIAGFIVSCHFIYKRELKDRRKIGQRASVLCLLLVFVFMSWMTCSWFKNNLLLYNAHSKYSFVTNFVVNLDYGIHFPEGVEEYKMEDKDLEGDFKPNVIVVMSEALSDLNGVFELGGQENLAYFKSLCEKYPSGVAYSSVKGNNTCSSEWEVLSGVSTALTIKGATIYQDNCKYMNSLVNVFNRRGYHTVGVHPYHRSGYNRDEVYSALGFKEEVFLDNFGENVDTIRQYVTDEENFKKVIELYEQRGDEPFFCFNITMQNHGGYRQPSKFVEPFETTQYDEVNQYLSLINKSDEMLKTLIEYFENEDEPTVILIFGDHQPSIPNEFYEEYFNTNMSSLTSEQLQKVYQVPYLIWANYDLNEDAAPEETSINYLSNVLFEVGNIPSTTWLKKLEEFRAEWPVLTVNFAEDKNGILYPTNEIKNNETVREYLMRSFAILLGEEEND